MRSDIPKREKEIRIWINEKQSKAFICRQLKCKPETLERHLRSLGIKYKGNQGLKHKPQNKNISNRISALDYIQTNNPKTYLIKQKLIEDKIKQHRCELCEKTEWNNKPIPLELHHLDGNRFNNTLDNLAILCPNCHAQQPNNSGLNIGNYGSVPELVAGT